MLRSTNAKKKTYNKKKTVGTSPGIVLHTILEGGKPF